METKRTYARPELKVVEVRHHGMLMTSGLQQGKAASMSVTYDEEDI